MLISINTETINFLYLFPEVKLYFYDSEKVSEKDFGYAKWDGDQSDYWRMENEINKHIFEANDIKEKEKIALEKERLENQLANIQGVSRSDGVVIFLYEYCFLEID